MSRKYDNHLTDDYINKLSYDLYMARQCIDTDKIKKKSLNNILTGKLTERQRNCIQLYYIKKIKMKDIAQALSVNVATVSRDIKQAKKIIWYEYYEN